MTEKEIVRQAMTARKMSQSKLAIEAGFKSQSNITGLLNNNKNGIRTDHLVRILAAMGCEVIVRDTVTKTEWLLDMNSAEG